MKIIIKDIENIYGQIDKCHIAEWGELNLKGGKGKLRIYSYASVAAYEAGKPSTMNRDIMVSFADLETFEPLWTELATGILSDMSGVFGGGTLGDATVPTQL